MIRFLSFLLITVQFILFTPRIDLTLMEAHAVDPIVELRPVVSAPVVDIEDPLIISYEDVLKDECTFVTACDGVTVEVVDEVDYLSFEVSVIDKDVIL